MPGTLKTQRLARHLPIAVAALVLTAGAALASLPVRADAIKLTSSQLTVRFKDGAVCRTPMQKDGGMGMFVDCPHQARFDVKIDHPSWLASVASDVFSPYATVRIISEDGQVQKFVTPGSRDPENRRTNRY